MQAELLSPLAASLGDWLARAFPDAAPSALAAATLCASRAGEGHVCIRLDAEAGKLWTGALLPNLDEWLTALDASGFVGQAGDLTPLIREGTRLYLGRLWADEATLADQLRIRAQPVGDAKWPQQVRTALDPLFAGTTSNDGQRIAAATALLNRIALISGGPGTGKTTTVAKVLAALVTLEPDSRIRLAAPTGKAAARMLEALNGAKAKLGLDLVTQAALPDTAITLHRLLGFRPDGAIPRHHADNPLALDALVVDEASMIDLALLRALLDALPAHARLILLGDKDQLDAVEAGSAFAELVGLADLGAEGATRLALATGTNTGRRSGFTPDTAPSASHTAMSGIKPDLQGTSHLGDAIAMLTFSHRFHADSGIGALARHANQGDVASALALLQAGTHADLHWHAGRVAEWQGKLLSTLTSQLAPYRAAIEARDIAAAWAAFDQLRLLCALREGPAGVNTLNTLIETRLWRADPRRQPWYAGRPVIIRSNDAATGLANGDIGLTLSTADGLRVHFPQAGGWRALAPARLPAHDTAFALTVHQSQGSEFREAWLLLPDDDATVLSRALVYTAITRARERFVLWGSGTTLAAAIARENRRESGLAARLS